VLRRFYKNLCSTSGHAGLVKVISIFSIAAGLLFKGLKKDVLLHEHKKA